MAGVNAWQRSIMTVNNGKFYIDTTRSKKTQQTSVALGKPDVATQPYIECSERKAGDCEPRSINVFEAGKTYLVFFVFAKNTTKQIYQMYVGTGFNPKDKQQFNGIKVTDTNIRYQYKKWDDIPWTAEMVEGSAKGVKDILQVTVDFADPKIKDNLDPGNGNPETCKPLSYCSWSGKTCGCNLSKDDARNKANPALWGTKGTDGLCAKTCSVWAVRDLDCPADGCLGFAFTLPAANVFAADDKNRRPKPTSIDDDPKWGPIWSKFSFTKPKQNAGDCTYSETNTPGKGSCGVADCPMGKGNPPFCDNPAPQ
jgi:cell migration-inducing and hyaluronan-binding protein